MGKYLKLFQQNAEYESFRNSDEYILPNVSWIVNNETVCYDPLPEQPASVGDIAYWDGSTVKFSSLESWNTSLGTPIGVCVVPEGFAPDGRPRIVSLRPVDASGNPTSSHVYMAWGAYTNTALTNYTRVPTTDNAGSTSTGSNGYGYLPSDRFNGAQSYVDPEAKYDVNTPMIPSPYLGDKPNPEYYKEISGNNALSDFNGLSNTEYLVGLGYNAANAAWNYSDGASNLQWYLPAAGELAYLTVRFNKINASISAVGGVAVGVSYHFWASSESNFYDAYYLFPGNGSIYSNGKTIDRCVRPFVDV